MFSPEGTLISASAAPHCGGAGKNKEEGQGRQSTCPGKDKEGQDRQGTRPGKDKEEGQEGQSTCPGKDREGQERQSTCPGKGRVVELGKTK